MSPRLGHGARAAALSPRSLSGDTCHHQGKSRQLTGCFLPFKWWMAWQGDTGWPVGPIINETLLPSTPAPVVTLSKTPAPPWEHPTHSACAKGDLNWLVPALGTPPSFCAPALPLILCWFFLGWDLPGGFSMVQRDGTIYSVPGLGCSQSLGGFRVATKCKGLE